MPYLWRVNQDIFARARTTMYNWRLETIRYTSGRMCAYERVYVCVCARLRDFEARLSGEKQSQRFHRSAARFDFWSDSDFVFCLSGNLEKIQRKERKKRQIRFVHGERKIWKHARNVDRGGVMHEGVECGIKERRRGNKTGRGCGNWDNRRNCCECRVHTCSVDFAFSDRGCTNGKKSLRDRNELANGKSRKEIMGK